MWRNPSTTLIKPCTVFLALGLLLAGCSSGGPYFVAEDEPWRRDAEMACLASGAVRPTPWIAQAQALGGPSVCGALQPFEVHAAVGGRVGLKPDAKVQCAMIPAIESWLSQIVLPAAQRNLGQPVIEISILSSYSCRPMNGIAGGRLSEHGHANAIDVGAFTLADGSKIKVLSGWRGPAHEQAFLREVHDGGCRVFMTVLGPDYDRFHRDHFHLDLARHGGGKRICK